MLKVLVYLAGKNYPTASIRDWSKIHTTRTNRERTDCFILTVSKMLIMMLQLVISSANLTFPLELDRSSRYVFDWIKVRVFGFCFCCCVDCADRRLMPVYTVMPYIYWQWNCNSHDHSGFSVEQIWEKFRSDATMLWQFQSQSIARYCPHLFSHLRRFRLTKFRTHATHQAMSQIS